MRVREDVVVLVLVLKVSCFIHFISSPKESFLSFSLPIAFHFRAHHLCYCRSMLAPLHFGGGRGGGP